jgi:DNA-binding response OmpR family regulator
MTETLLIVEPDFPSSCSMVESLTPGRYRTLTAPEFGIGMQLLQSERPHLLITVVRLGQFNGLHLVVLGRASDPRLAAIVIDDRKDSVLEREAKQAGATAYLVKPVAAPELLRRVAEALAGRERRWSNRTPLADEVLFGIGAGTARLLDISYGGFRLESTSIHMHPVLKLDLPILGLSVNARRVWSRRTDVETVWKCGAAIMAPVDSEGTQRWRRLVDTVRGGDSLGPIRHKR